MKALLFILLLVVVGCRQDLPAPDVSFTTIDDGKGFIQFTLKSTNALSYVWNFGDGSPVNTNKNASHSYSANGTYTVKVEATGPWGKTTMSNDITVTTVRGSAMFWMPKGKSNVEVFVEDVWVGIIYNFFSNGVTYCGTNGCAQASNLTEGEHRYTAREDGSNEIKWTGTVSVVGGQCTKTALTY